jgi:hypothetical protein
MPAGERPPGREHHGGGGRGDGIEDPLRLLEQHLQQASDAAERLFAGAAGGARPAAGRGSHRADTPPSGWQLPEGEISSGKAAMDGHLELLWQLLRSLRDLIPPELQRRLAEAVRELLLAIRALIDWYLERDRRPDGPPEVQDIPIL